MAIPGDMVIDVDGDSLALTATLADGSKLPDWLDFSNGAFTGTVPPKAGGQALCITVTAADASGATAVDTFHLTIAQPGALHASPAAGHPKNVDDRCHLDDYQAETALIGVAAAAEIWI